MQCIDRHLGDRGWQFRILPVEKCIALLGDVYSRNGSTFAGVPRQFCLWFPIAFIQQHLTKHCVQCWGGEETCYSIPFHKDAQG